MINDEKKERHFFDHEADGIRELDNLLPRWWVWLFWLCNAFALAYMLYYHVFTLGDTQAAAYAPETKAGEELKTVALTKFESTLASLTPSKDPAELSEG